MQKTLRSFLTILSAVTYCEYGIGVADACREGGCLE
ncbi:hypothetical protein C7445_1127 [Alicyclobacillus sacchari]|uniref:Uncharacterized protein n=1 Tax=Alicyclobacillus sacchari TaxID=392010 RepID=A0A4R8LI99_9BACL|nr:hypothetical protein C7445_1127 [Alicyclobacillus sacchari]